MNNTEIALARQKYNDLKLKQQEYKQMKQRILELEQNPIVQEYLNLVDLVKEQAENKRFEEHEMISNAFEELALSTNDSNNILVYMGAYKYTVLVPILVKTKNDYNDADYVLYRDLETCRFFKVNIHNKKMFEKESNVIFLDDTNFTSHLDYLNGFKKLTSMFFKELLVKPQEEVVKQFVKKNQNSKH